MATVRETIEIVVSGGQKVEALKNQLLAAANAAAALADQVGEIDNRLKGADQEVATFARNSAALSRTNRVIRGELGRESDYQRRRRSAQDRIRALRQSGQFSQARSATERLEGRDQQRVRLRESARLLNAELAERKRTLVELLQVRGIVKREKAQAVARQRLAQKLVTTDQAILERQQASLREARGSLARGARRTVTETRERSTDVLFRRRSAQANRLLTSGQSGGLSKTRRAELERLSGEIDQVRDRFATLNDGLRALRETAKQSGESPAKINQQIRAFATARRETAVELGRLVQDLLEVNRTARGSRRNFDKGRRLTERVNELARVGAVDQEGRKKLISRIGAAGSARARGNIQEAQDLLEKAETTISAKERQLKLDKKLQQEARQQVRANEAASSSAVAREKQRQSALTQENKALNSIRVQQQQIADLASKPGATGLSNFQRASGAVARLPQLFEAGDLNEFNRVLGDATAFSKIVRSELGIQARAATARTKDEKEIQKINKKVLSGKRLEVSEVDRLNALRPPASALPALPAAAPGAAALGGRARPLRTQSTVGGVSQPLIQEVLGGSRTAKDASDALAGTLALQKRYNDGLVQESQVQAKLQKQTSEQVANAQALVKQRNTATLQLESQLALVEKYQAKIQDLEQVAPNNRNLESAKKAVERLPQLLEDGNEFGFEYAKKRADREIANTERFIRLEKRKAKASRDTAKALREDTKNQVESSLSLQKQKDSEILLLEKSLNIIEKAQRRVSSLASAGASGADFETAQAAVNRLPEVLASGNASAFKTLNERANTYLGFSEQAIKNGETLQRNAKQRAKAEKSVGDAYQEYLVAYEKAENAIGRARNAGANFGSEDLDQLLNGYKDIEQSSANRIKLGKQELSDFDKKLKLEKERANRIEKIASSTSLGLKVEQQLIGLQQEGVDVSGQLLTLREALNKSIQNGGKLGIRDQSILEDQVKRSQELFGIESKRLSNSKKAANLSEAALDTELDKRLKIEDAQQRLSALQERRPGSVQAQRAKSLFDDLVSAGESGSDRQFKRIDREFRQAVRMASPSSSGGAASRVERISNAPSSPIDAPLQLERLQLDAENQITALNKLEAKGVDIASRRNSLQLQLSRTRESDYLLSERQLKVLKDEVSASSKLARNERAKLVSKGGADPQAAQQRLTRDLFAGQNIVGKLQNLERKRVAGFGAADPRTVEVSQQVVRLETELNTAKQTGFELTKQNLDTLSATVNKSRQLLELDAQQNKLSAETAKIRRLQGDRRLPQLQRESLTSILGDLGRADTAAKVFRGGRSGEQALSDAIRAFNAATGPQPRSALLAPGSTGGLRTTTQKGVPIGAGAAAEAGAAGKNVAKTLSDTISAGTASAASAGAKLASAVTGAIERVFDINSPSGWAIGIAKNVISTLAGNISAGVPVVQSALRELLRFVDQYSDEGRAASSSSLARSFDFGAKNPSLGASYGSLNQSIADLTINPQLYRSRLESVGLQNMPGSLLAEASGRGTLQEFFPELKLERVFKQLPGTLEKIIDTAFVKSAERYSSTRFVSQSPAIATPSLLGAASGLNPGVLFGSSGRLRGKAPRRFSGSTAPIFNAPSSLLDLVGDPWATAPAFSFGSRRPMPPAMSIFSAPTFSNRQIEDPWTSPSSFRFSDPAKLSAETFANIEPEIAKGETGLRSAVGNFFGNLKNRLGAVSGGGGGRPPGGPTPPNGPSPDDFEGRIEGARGNAQKLLGLADLADLSQASNKQLQLFAAALAETRDGLKATDAAFGKINKVLDRTEDALARRDPDADLLVRGFGRRGGQAVGEGLIGGAFPLLFGQGAGAAAFGGLGGALGGFAGGTLGFGLSLAGTAIGSQVDALAQAAQDTGNLLGELSSDVSGSFEKIKEAGLLASRSQEKLVASLLEAGNKTAAYAIIQEELNNKLGVDGAEKLRAAADAGDRLKRAMADLGIELQLLVAGPLTKFLNAVSGALEQRGRAEQARTVFGELPADKREKFIQELTRENVKRGGTKENIQGAELFAQITEKLDAATIRSITEKLATSQPRKQTDAEKRQETIRNAETGLARVQRGLDAVNKRNEGAELVKGFKQQALAAKREQEDLDRQAFELRRDYERQIEDIRRGIEDRINQIRQENQQRELEILVKQGQIREQQFKNASTALQSALAGDPLAQSLADAVTTYLGAQMSAQDQLEQRRKQFEIEITNQQLETEKFKLEVGRTLSRLNTDTAEKVAEINKGVRRNNENAALNEFNLQKESASLRAEVIRNELLVLQAKQKDFVETAKFRAQESPSPENTRIAEAEQKRLDIFTGALADAAANIQTIKQTQPPQLLREISAPAAKSVSFAGVNQGIARAGQLREQLKRLEKELLDLVKGGNLELFAKQLGEIAFGSFFELNNSLRNAKQEAASASGDVSASIQAVTDSYSEFFALAQQTGVNIDEPTRKFIEEIRDGQIAFEKIKPSMEFYASNLQDITAQTKQSRAAIDELLLPTKAYDRELAKINARGGLGINPEEEQLLLKNARALDEINAKLRVLEGLRDIASGWTDSFIQLNKELLKGGNLLESVQRFAESVADRTLDVVLEFTLRPIQERLFKNMTDILGIKAPEDPALQPIRETAANTKVLADKAKKEFAGKTGVPLSQPVAAQAPANGIVPGPGAMAQRQGYPEYIDKSVLRNWLISQGMGRTSGDFTNAGHRTPNHMLNAMDMGFIDPKYDSNYVQKTKEMEAKLRATGAFGNQLFGPTSDPGGHGTHLHIPTPGGRVKVTPGLAQLMGLGQPMQQGQTYPSVGNGQPVEVSVVDAPALMASSLKGPGQAYPIPASQLPSGGAVPGQPVQIQQVPFVEPQPESPVAPAANQAAESLGNLDQKARQTAEGVTQVGTQMSDSVSKFQQIVGTGLQAITSVAMGIGGVQMIRKGGAYNTLMGAASIFGSIGSLTGMFGTGGPLSGLFGKKATPVGARALGGPVFKGEEYLVGEEGPEVIRMGANGTVIPADELYVPGLDDRDSSSAPPIGRYARRSNASSDMADGDSERSVYGDTYERGSSSTTYIGNYGRTVPYQRSETSREIDRLERVTSSPSELPPIKYETTRVNEYDFVTPEQLEASNARTAKVARNQTIRELADSLKTRKRLGL